MRIVAIFGVIGASMGWASWQLALAAPGSGITPWYAAGAIAFLLGSVISTGMVLVELYELCVNAQEKKIDKEVERRVHDKNKKNRKRRDSTTGYSELKGILN